MRPAWSALAIVLTVVGGFAHDASAANRRRVPRGGGGFAQGGALRADDAIRTIVAQTPTGGVASLPPGRYRTSLVIDRPMRVLGAMLGTVLDAQGTGQPAITVAQGVENVTIELVTLVGGTPAAIVTQGGNAGLLLRRVSIDAANADGLRVVGADAATIDRVTVENAGGTAFDLDGKGLRASRLLVRRSAGTAIDLHGENASLSDSAFDGGADGVVFEGLRETVTRCSFRGVAVAARFAATSDTCAFRANEVRDATNAVVADLGSTYGVVEANRLVSSKGDAVRLAGSWHTVERNDVVGTRGVAVVATGTSLRIADNRIASPTGDAVSVTGDGNMVDSNAIDAPGGAAVAVRGDGNVVALNACQGAATDAIVLEGGNNRLVGNVVDHGLGEGLRIDGDANTLQGNDVHDVEGNGLHIAGGAANVLDSNHLLRCGGQGFLDEGVGTVLTKNRVD